MPRKDPTRDQLDALHQLSLEPWREDAPQALRAALGSRSSHVVARAARIVGEQLVPGLEDALLRAYGRLFTRPVKTDPGCTAKVALAEALDRLELLDPEPFERGARHVQKEAAWGPPVDTAVGLRSACGHALVRAAGTEALPVLADLYADPEARVRIEAARALGAAGWPGALALLRFRLRQMQAAVGESGRGTWDLAEVDALLEGLVRSGGHDGLALVMDLVDAPAFSDAALFALAESRRDEVVPALERALAAAVRPQDEQRALTALAVHRTRASQAVLLRVIGDATVLRAKAAIRALEPQAFDAAMAARVRQTVADRGERAREHAVLTAAVDAIFGAEAV